MSKFLKARIKRCQLRDEWFMSNSIRKSNSNWYVYIVECADGTLYTGVTTNLKRRINEHNYSIHKGSKYTRSRRPVRLVDAVGVDTRSEASRLEYKIKAKKRSEKIKYLKNYSGEFKWT